MNLEEGDGLFQHHDPLYDKVFDLVHTYIQSKNPEYAEMAANQLASDRIDLKVTKILKILSDNDSQSEKVKLEEDRKSDEDKQEFSSHNDMLRNLCFEEEEALEHRMIKKLFQQDIQSPSSGDQPNAIQLREALNEPDSIVLKEEEEENKYYAIKFEEFLNHPINSNRRMTRSQLKHQTESQQIHEEAETPEIEISCWSHTDENTTHPRLIKKPSKDMSKKAPKEMRKSKKIFSHGSKSRKITVSKIKTEFVPVWKVQTASTHGRKPANPDMEKRLIIWISKVLNLGLKISQTEIRQKAREIMRKHYQDREFTASKGWMEKFFRRHKTVSELITQQNKSCLDAIDSESEDLTPNEPSRIPKQRLKPSTIFSILSDPVTSRKP